MAAIHFQWPMLKILNCSDRVVAKVVMRTGQIHISHRGTDVRWALRSTADLIQGVREAQVWSAGHLSVWVELKVIKRRDEKLAPRLSALRLVHISSYFLIISSQCRLQADHFKA